MEWIEVIDEDSANGDLKVLYEGMLDPESGRVDRIMAVHSLHPAGLAAHNSLYKAAMTGTKTLRKVEREMIALVVSGINECHY